MPLQKTDIQAVWILTVPDRAPYPSVDRLADSALLRHRPHTVAPVSQYRIDRTSWKFSVRQHKGIPLSDAVKSMPTDAETGFKVLRKAMEAIEMASDHLLPIIPVLLHPELILIEHDENDRNRFDVQIVTLPLANTEYWQSGREPGLIEWLGDIFSWDTAVISQLAELFRKELFFDLLLETEILCGESHNMSADTEYRQTNQQKVERPCSLPTGHHEAKTINRNKQMTTDESSGKRFISGLKRLGEALFGYGNQEMIHEVTEELDLASNRFRMAQLSEGLPGTPDEELGHHAYILTEEFVIGRDMGQSDFWIDSSSISRRHAVIRRRAGSYFIEDLGSKNGTTMDSVKLPKHREQLLPGKCKIGFADHVYYFRST